MTYDRTPCLEITAEALDRDPYPTFRTLQSGSSVGWVPDLSMWLVAGYRDGNSMNDSNPGSVGRSARLASVLPWRRGRMRVRVCSSTAS